MSRPSSFYQFASSSSSSSSPPSASFSPFSSASNFDDYRHMPPPRPSSQPGAANEGQPRPEGRHIYWESAGTAQVDAWDEEGEKYITMREHIVMANPDMCDDCYHSDFEFCIHVEPLTMVKESTVVIGNRQPSGDEDDEGRFVQIDSPRIEQLSPYPPPPPPFVFIGSPQCPSPQQCRRAPLSPMSTATSPDVPHSESPIDEIYTHQTQPWKHASSTGLPLCGSPPPTPRLAPWELAGVENALHLNANSAQEGSQGPAPPASTRLPRYLALRSPAASPKPTSPSQLPPTPSPSPLQKSSTLAPSPNAESHPSPPTRSPKPPPSHLTTLCPLPPSPSPSPRPSSQPFDTNAKPTGVPAKQPPMRSDTQSTSLSALTILAVPVEARRHARASSDSKVVRNDPELLHVLGIRRQPRTHFRDLPKGEDDTQSSEVQEGDRAEPQRGRGQVMINVVPPSEDVSGNTARGGNFLEKFESKSSGMLRVDVDFRSPSPRKRVTIVSPASTSSTPISGLTALPNPHSPVISPASGMSNTVVGSDDGYESTCSRDRKHGFGGGARRSGPKTSGSATPTRDDAPITSPTRSQPGLAHRRSSLFATDEDPYQPNEPVESVAAWLAGHSDETYTGSEISLEDSPTASPAARFLQPGIGFEDWLTMQSPGVSPAPALVDLDAASPACRPTKVSPSECDREEEGAQRMMQKLAQERQKCEIAVRECRLVEQERRGKLADCVALASAIRRDVSQAYAHLDRALQGALDALDYDLVLMGHHRERRWANEFVDVLCSTRRAVARTMAHIEEMPRADHVAAHTLKITDYVSQLESRSDKVKRSISSMKIFQLKTQLREEQDSLQRATRGEQARREVFDAEARKERLAQKEKMRQYEVLMDATHRRMSSAP